MYRKSVALLALGLVLAIAGGVQAQVIEGKVLFEYWFGGGINNLLDTLKAHPDFPDNAHDGALLDALDHPDWANLDYWGARGRAYLTAPADGDYTFWIAADDDCDLYLSTDEDPANAVMIAQLVGWCGYQDYAGTSGSRGDNYISDPVPLVAGQRYYVEMLFCDGTGGGHGSIGWTGPGIADPVPVPSDVLSTEAAWIPAILYQAKNPEPADGATEITAPLFKWEAGTDAVMHEVYMGTNPEPGPAEFKGPMPVALYFHIEPLVPGATYYWRIDEVRADGSKTEGQVWSFTVMPLEAHFPVPEDGAVEIPVSTTLSWTAGQTAASHVAYLSKDLAAVEAADPAAMLEVEGTSVDVSGLEGFTTYYWRVDTTCTAGTLIPGPVWSFTSIDYLPISEDPVTLEYDNTADPFLSSLTLDTPIDWTVEGVTDLSMMLQGRAGPAGDVVLDEATGTYEVTGAGNDIWGNADQFTYAYKTLNGDASMVARVVSNGSGSNEWAKGGVMIRQSLGAGSQHAFMPITGGGGNGASFQRRIETDGSSSNSDSGETVAPPYWVKLDRVGNSFSGSISPDGETWTQLGDPVEIAMADPVLIGLAVTSHQSGELRTMTFDSLSVTGDVAEGPFTTFSVINIPYNSAEPIYAAVEDAAGAMAVVTHPDPAATQITTWSSWKIALAEVAAQGVDLTNVVALHLGVGDVLNPVPGGTGSVQFDNVRVTLPVQKEGAIVWVSYHAADDEPHADAAAVGFTQAPDIEYTDLLRAQGYDVTRYVTTKSPDVDYLNGFDLVIISRTASSGHYSGSGASLWNSVTAPLINLNGYTLRSSRLGFTDGTTMVDTTGDVRLAVADPTHPIFAGIALTDGVMDNPFAEGAVPLTTDPTIISRGISVNDNTLDEEGTLLATIAEVSADTGPVGGLMIAELPAGATMQNSSGSSDDVLGAARLVFLTGSREPSGVTGGQAAALFDLYPDGEQMFLNAVDYMLNPPAPPVTNILANGGLEDDLSGAPWSTYGDASFEVVHDLVDAAVPEGPIEGDHCLHVTVGSAGANFWDAGLQHAGHVFEAGKSYTLSVWFKSKSGPFNINIKPERAADPWDGFGSQEITITEEWAQYTVNTGVIAETVDPASITFHIAYAPGEFWLDDAVFSEDE